MHSSHGDAGVTPFLSSKCRRLQATAAAHYHVARTAAAKLGAVHRIPDPHFTHVWLVQLVCIVQYAPPQLANQELFSLLLPAARESVSRWARLDTPHTQLATPPCGFAPCAHTAQTPA